MSDEPTQEKQLFSTAEAAEYLGISLSSMKYHVHIAGNVKGQLIGKTLVFTREELDRFEANRRPQGRPPKSAE
jgi:hypothetical protein